MKQTLKGEHAYNQISNFINGLSSRDRKGFVETAGKDDPRVQQALVVTLQDIMSNMAENYAAGYYDARNEATCKFGKKVVEYSRGTDRTISPDLSDIPEIHVTPKSIDPEGYEGRKAYQTLSNFLKGMSIADRETFAQKASCDHRTLQQLFIGLFVQVLEKYAENNSNPFASLVNSMDIYDRRFPYI